MKVSFDLTGKVAVITGGAGILCSEMARQLADVGCKVAVLDLNGEKAAELAQTITENGGEAIGLFVDVLDKESLEKAKDAVLERFGRVDILINGAGGNKKEATTNDGMSFFDIPVDALQWVFNLNFMGTVLTTQVFGKVMAQQGEGSVINISSMASLTPLTRVVGYAAAKAAINNFTQWMAVEFNQNYSTKIRVNAIAPGFLLTEQNRFLLTDEKTGEDTPRGKAVKANTPMGRYGSPDELVGAVIWLASDAASFVTGIVVPIDGGFSAFSGV
ncbi:MAG: SDR family oxidoreductase [Clostridia bacterium]|jgi:NAD(P)-dependent dehydrogenase (short-subunit alcohol dehydrogenase family)